MATGVCYTQSGDIKRYEASEWHGFASSGEPVLSAYGTISEFEINNQHTYWHICGDDETIFDKLIFPYPDNKILFTITKEPSSSSYEYEIQTTYFYDDNYIDDFKNFTISYFNTQTGKNIDDYYVYFNPDSIYSGDIMVQHGFDIVGSVYTYYNTKNKWFNDVHFGNNHIVFRKKPTKQINGVLFNCILEFDESSEFSFNLLQQSLKTNQTVFNTIQPSDLILYFGDSTDSISVTVEFISINLQISKDSKSLGVTTNYPIIDSNTKLDIGTKIRLYVANTIDDSNVLSVNGWNVGFKCKYEINSYLSFEEDDLINYGSATSYFGTMTPSNTVTLSFNCNYVGQLSKVTIKFTSSATVKNNTTIESYIYYIYSEVVENYTFYVTVLYLGTTTSSESYRSEKTFVIKNSTPFNASFNYSGMKNISSTVTNVTWSPSKLPDTVEKVTWESQPTES